MLAQCLEVNEIAVCALLPLLVPVGNAATWQVARNLRLHVALRAFVRRVRAWSSRRKQYGLLLLGLITWSRLDRNEEHTASNLLKKGVHVGARLWREKALGSNEAKAKVRRLQVGSAGPIMCLQVKHCKSSMWKDYQRISLRFGRSKWLSLVRARARTARFMTRQKMIRERVKFVHVSVRSSTIYGPLTV